MAESLWWLSFADKKFLGACIVRADSITHAINRSIELGCNPGSGQVAGSRIPTSDYVPEEYIGKLLDTAGVDAFKKAANS